MVDLGEQVEEYLLAPAAYQAGCRRAVTIVPELEAFLAGNPPSYTPTAVPASLCGPRRTHCFSASHLGLESGTSADGRYKIGCEASLYHRFVGHRRRRVRTAADALRLDSGHALHGMFQYFMEAMTASPTGGRKIADFRREVAIAPDQQPMADALSIYSTIDGVYHVGCIPSLLEFKTIGVASFDKLTRPKPGHLTQGQVYMACMDVPTISFVYMSYEARPRLKEFVVGFDRHHWLAIVDKIERVRTCANTGGRPVEEGGQWFCRSCDYRYLCTRPDRLTIKPIRLPSTKGGRQ